REQGIEGPERVVPGMAIPRGGVDLEPQARAPAEIRERVAAPRTHGPRPGLLAADPTRLPHCLQIPVEPFEGARVTHVQDVSPLVAPGIQILCSVQLEARVVCRELARSDVLPLDPEPSVLEIPVRVVVERMRVPILDRSAPERDEAPQIHFPVEPGCVV